MGKEDRESFTLRDMRRMIGKAARTSSESLKLASDGPLLARTGRRSTPLPHLFQSGWRYRRWRHSAWKEWSCLPKSERAKIPRPEFARNKFASKLDQMIEQHGPDTVISRGDGHQWTFDLTEGESICETNKGGRAGPSAAQGIDTPITTDLAGLLRAMRRPESRGPSATGNGESDPSLDQSVDGVSSVPAARKGSGRRQAAGGDVQSRSFRKQALSAEEKLTGNARLLGSLQPKTVTTGDKGDKQGVGIPAATSYRGTGRPLQSLGSGLETKLPFGCSTGDVASPGSHLPPKPGVSGESYGNGFAATDDDWLWGGGYSSYGAVNAYKGFSLFSPNAFKPSYFYGSLGLGTGKIRPVTSKAEWNCDTASISVEDSFRNENPGGMVNAIEAGSMSKTLKKHAASIQASMEACLVAMDIGAGLDPSPRKSGKRLVKELVGSSYRMARCHREELQTGLKLILVDISPSCSEIRDACYAAALAISDLDKDAVVVCHFNGYTQTEYTASVGDVTASTMLVGARQKEVPHFGPDLIEEIEKWAATADISGVIAFGDGDAASLYALLAKYTPMIWLFPGTEDYAKELLSLYQPKEVLDRNGKLWIVSRVVDAKTCVQGLRKVTKGK